MALKKMGGVKGAGSRGRGRGEGLRVAFPDLDRLRHVTTILSAFQCNAFVMGLCNTGESPRCPAAP